MGMMLMKNIFDMATLKIYHCLLELSPNILNVIKDYFESMYICDEQKEFTVYQVELPEKIGDFEIVLEIQSVLGGDVVLGYRKVTNIGFSELYAHSCLVNGYYKLGKKWVWYKSFFCLNYGIDISMN